MHWRVLGLHGCLLLLCQLVLGCSCGPPPLPPLKAEEEAASSGPRYVVAMPNSSCPVIEGWTAESLALPEAPDSLRRFCSYRWTGPGSYPGGPPVFTESTGLPLVGPDPERPIVLPQLGGLQDDLLRDKQNERLLVELGAVPSTTSSDKELPIVPHVAIIDTVAQRPNIRPTPHFAIIDTVAQRPKTTGSVGSMEHGLAVDAIIGAVACPLDPHKCVGQRSFVAALEDDPLTPIPDAIGSPFMLAQAIVAAVEEWEHLGSTEPLILNLSLGWDWSPLETELLLQGPSRFRHLELDPHDIPDDGVSAETHAVVAALAWASCKGALAIAASGNVRGRSCSKDEDGPTAPGAWEAIPAPTPDECWAWFGITTTPTEQEYAPLVYAAGGVDRVNEPIGNARASSLPPRVLYSAMAAVDANGVPTGPWTGTSVATAALSGIAARVWSRHPNDDAHAIMSRIDRQGEPLASLRPASVVLTGHTREVRRLWAHAYEPVGLNAPPGDFAVSLAPVESFTAREVSKVLTSSGITVGHARPSALITNRPWPMPMTTKLPECYGREVKRHGQFPQPQKWPSLPDPAFRPQPDVPICPTCPLVADGRGGYELHIDIDDDFQQSTIANLAILEIIESKTIHELYVDVSSCGFTSQSKPPCRLSLAGYRLNTTTTTMLEDYLRANQSSIFSGRLLFSVRTATSQEQLLGNEIEVFH